MGRVVHFEFPVDDADRAAKFYEKVLGWKTTTWQGPIEYFLVSTGRDDEPGIDGALLPRSDPNQPVVVTVQVDSVDDTVELALTSGGLLALPKQAIPGVGWVAYIIDSEKNVIGLMQDDASAGT